MAHFQCELKFTNIHSKKFYNFIIKILQIKSKILCKGVVGLGNTIGIYFNTNIISHSKEIKWYEIRIKVLHFFLIVLNYNIKINIIFNFKYITYIQSNENINIFELNAMYSRNEKHPSGRLFALKLKM